jgi:sulfur-carrier protein adenylyltransferase/sulfurtransferase
MPRDRRASASSSMAVPEIEPREIKRRQDGGESIHVLDVREPWELAIVRLPGTINIPMNELPDRLQELDPQAELVVMCHGGSRSRRVAAYLQTRGFDRVANLTGGINAWARDIDPALPSY